MNAYMKWWQVLITMKRKEEYWESVIISFASTIVFSKLGNICKIAQIIFKVTISPEKLFYGEKKSIALYLSVHTLWSLWLGLELS